MKSQTHLRNPRSGWFDGNPHRWGVILAGGDGTRLRSLTRMIAGDERPKQFCAVAGRKTLLDQTRDRVRKVVRPHQTLIVVTRTHEAYYDTLLLDSTGSLVLAQPCNRGTAPAIAYSLMRLRELDPSAVVAMFPSDHHFANDSAFAASLETAFHSAETQTDQVVLLGIRPDCPEVSYGWIEPGAPLGASLPDSVCHVRSFWEKPSPALAEALMSDGCLWNSFIMVGKVGTFWALLQRALPSLAGAFEAIRSTSSTEREETALLDLYTDIASASFSDDVLSEYPDWLAVVPGNNLGWSDLGEPRRVLSLLERQGLKPAWDRQPETSNMVAEHSSC